MREVKGRRRRRRRRVRKKRVKMKRKECTSRMKEYFKPE